MAVLLLAAVLVNGAPPPVESGSGQAAPAATPWLAFRPCSSRSPAARASSACTSPGAWSATGTPSASSISPRSTTCRRSPGASRRATATSAASDARRLVAGADVLVHAAAALPIQVTRDAIWSVRVEGTAVTLGAALEAGVRRVVLISSTAVYGVPERHPIHEDDPLVGVGHYGESKIEAERLCAVRPAGPRGRRRPAEDVRRPRAAWVFEILFDWIREGRRIDPRRRLEPLPAARRRGSRRRGRPLLRRPGRGRGAEHRRGTVRHRPRGSRGARRARRLGSRLGPFRPGRRSSLFAGSSWRGSPLAEWHYRTGHKDSFVSIDKAQSLLRWEPRLSNAETLCATARTGTSRTASGSAPRATHRVPWDQRALGVLRRLS